jgi:2-polyprenyl-6-methoxyphenol hydroxylase-like FAD-dependent oxidoreductase
MSPVGGVGINYAIQDAVAAANVLSQHFKAGKVPLTALAAVQRQREFPTRIIQAFQEAIQKRIISQALDPNRTFAPPAFLRLPILRDLPAKLIAFGVFPAHVKT